MPAVMEADALAVQPVRPVLRPFAWHTRTHPLILLDPAGR